MSDILKLALAKIEPQTIGANLIHEINIQQIVSVDIGNHNSRAVIIVDWFVIAAGIINNLVHEIDAAAYPLIGKTKIVINTNAFGSF